MDDNSQKVLFQFIERSFLFAVRQTMTFANYCQRWAWTIYFYTELPNPTNEIGDVLRKVGDLPDDYEQKKVTLAVETPEISRRDEFHWATICVLKFRCSIAITHPNITIRCFCIVTTSMPEGCVDFRLRWHSREIGFKISNSIRDLSAVASAQKPTALNRQTLSSAADAFQGKTCRDACW
ncbi:MAG: hypothetical protein CME32_27970 [Gimesia sp.]|nr:hypothetical protein [Gimesia sp.]